MKQYIDVLKRNLASKYALIYSIGQYHMMQSYAVCSRANMSQKEKDDLMNFINGVTEEEVYEDEVFKTQDEYSNKCLEHYEMFNDGLDMCKAASLDIETVKSLCKYLFNEIDTAGISFRCYTDYIRHFEGLFCYRSGLLTYEELLGSLVVFNPVNGGYRRDNIEYFYNTIETILHHYCRIAATRRTRKTRKENK